MRSPPLPPRAAPGRTPLTYYGGKARLANKIVAVFPAHRVYVEPFAGGAAVLFAKPRAARETLNDLDARVMNFWRVLRDTPVALATAVAQTPYGRYEWARADVGGEGADTLEEARRFVVHTAQSYAAERSGWSAPALGAGRNQWQPATWAGLPPRLLAAAQRLHGVALECQDAISVIARYDVPGALMYVDPPYDPATRRTPKHGYDHDIDVDFWPALCSALANVSHAAVVLSGYPCAATDALGWPATALARGDNFGGADRPETLWIRP